MAKQCRYNIMSEQQVNHRIHWPPWVIRDHRTGAHNDASAKGQTSKTLQPTARANPRLHGRIILRTHCFSNFSPVVLVLVTGVSSVVLMPPHAALDGISTSRSFPLPHHGTGTQSNSTSSAWKLQMPSSSKPNHHTIATTTTTTRHVEHT